MKKLKWEKPVLESFDTVGVLECACRSGSNANNRCNPTGGSASGSCLNNGSSAGKRCSTGGSAAGHCDPGAAPSL